LGWRGGAKVELGCENWRPILVVCMQGEGHRWRSHTQAQQVQGRKKQLNGPVRPCIDTRRTRSGVRVLHNEPGQGEGKAKQVARLASQEWQRPMSRLHTDAVHAGQREEPCNDVWQERRQAMERGCMERHVRRIEAGEFNIQHMTT
jgi:hypothetical protein